MKRFYLLSILLISLYACKKTGRDCSNEIIGTVKDYTGKLDGCKMMIELKDGSMLEVHSIPAGVTLVDGKEVAIKYTLTANAVSICMAGKLADITALRYL